MAVTECDTKISSQLCDMVLAPDKLSRLSVISIFPAARQVKGVIKKIFNKSVPPTRLLHTYMDTRSATKHCDRAKILCKITQYIGSDGSKQRPHRKTVCSGLGGTPASRPCGLDVHHLPGLQFRSQKRPSETCLRLPEQPHVSSELHRQVC
jgi:hypothetical protein